jgi:hypothetical protein
MTLDAWAQTLEEVTDETGIEVLPAQDWRAREERMRHVCRTIAIDLDRSEPGSPRRSQLARAYARAFRLFVEAGQRRHETLRPGA